METIPAEKIEKIGTNIYNYSDSELIFKELCIKCQSLKTQNMKMLQVRKSLSILNEKNEVMYKSLLKIKTDYEKFKSNLCKRLYTLKLSTDKQKILSRKKLDEFHLKQKGFEEYYKVSPYKLELDELIKRNIGLEQEWKNKTDLYKLTKKQYDELKSLIIEALKKKVCEFCDIVLRLEAFSK